jgi:hypothetical protein
LETSLRKTYGFLNAYTGYFLHVGATENEINELGGDAETLSPSERRIRRLRHEESKWDPEHYMYVAPFPPNVKPKELTQKGTSVVLAVTVTVDPVWFSSGRTFRITSR